MSGKIYGGTGAIGHMFVYDPATGVSTDLGQAVAGIDVVKSLTASGGKIYGGTGEYGADGHFFVCDPPSGSCTDLGVAVAGGDRILSLTTGADGTIYGGTSWAGNLFTYDPATGVLVDIGPGAPGWGIYALAGAPDGTISGGSSGGYLFAYHPASGLFDNLGQPVPNEWSITALALGAGGAVYGGTGGEKGHLFTYDPATAATTDKGRARWGSSYVYALARTPDGKIYGGGAQGLFLYDPANHPYRSPGTATSVDIIPAIRDLGWLPDPSFVYAMAKGSDGTIYIGGGWDAHLWAYDPETGSVTDLGAAVVGQYYVASLTAGADGTIYGGTRSGDPYTAGHLFAYDPSTGSMADLGQPVATDWQVYALATGADGKIYGGTYGVETTSGHLFVYDPANGSIVDRGQAVAGERGVFALARGAGGKIYGGTYWQGHLFVYDPATGALTDLGTGAPGHSTIGALVGAPDGTIYGTTAYEGHLFRYHPTTGVFDDLGTPVAGGNDYYALVMAGATLYGASSLTGTDRPLGVLYAHDTLTGATWVIGAPRPRSTYLWALAAGDGGLIYGVVSDDAHLFSYTPGFAFDWGNVLFEASTPANTSLHVDVLSQQGSVLRNDVASGTSLASVSAAAYPALRLRAELSTGSGDATPHLLEWSVTWTTVSVVPEFLSFMLAPEEPDTASRHLTVSTTGDDTVSWTAAADQPWLSVSPASGAVPATLTVTVDKAGLAPDAWYPGSVTVWWDGEWETGSAEVVVSLYVGEHVHVFLPVVAQAR